MLDLRIINVLQSCGLNKTEAVLLADLIARGESTAGALSGRCALKRATVYSALAQLEEQGLVHRRRLASVTRFSALKHAELVEAVRRQWDLKRSVVHDATSALGDLLSEYPEGRSQRIGSYEIVSYESRKKTEEFFLRTLKEGHYHSIYDIGMFSTGRWRALMLELLVSTAKTKPPIRELIVATSDPSWYVSKVKNPNHQVKILNSRGPVASDFTVVPDGVILNSYEMGSEISLQIKHAGYRAMMLRIFEVLWGSAKDF